MQRVTWSSIALVLGISACGHRGKMVVDTPIKPYQAPDISEITGIDEDEATESEKTEPAPAPAPASAPTPAPAAAPTAAPAPDKKAPDKKPPEKKPPAPAVEKK